MTREGLIDILEQAIDVMASASFPGSCGREVTSIDNPRETAIAALAAIEAAGVRLVPVEASCELEFARMADGTVKVGYNPRTEEGGWTLVGDVTKSVTAIEAQRDQALRDLDIANQRLSNVFAALAASPYAPQKDESHE